MVLALTVMHAMGRILTTDVLQKRGKAWKVELPAVHAHTRLTIAECVLMQQLYNTHRQLPP